MKQLFAMSWLAGGVLVAAMNTGMAATCRLDPPGAVIETTCFSGLSDDRGSGRYIRVDYPGAGSYTACSDDNTAFNVPAAFAPALQGRRTYTYSICKDKAGSACQPVATPSVTISKQSNGSYQADPQTLVVDFSNYTKQYPACKIEGYSS